MCHPGQKLNLIACGRHPLVWSVSSVAIDECIVKFHDINTGMAQVSMGLQMVERITYNNFLSATIVGFLQDGWIEVIEVEFSLEHNLVVGVEEIECKHCFQSLEGCRVPANPQELAILLDPQSVLCAHTKLHIEMAYTIDVDYKYRLSHWTQWWAGSVLMANIKTMI